MTRIKRASSVISFFLVTILIAGLTFFYLEQSIIFEKTPGYYFDPISLPNQIFIAFVIVSLVSVFIVYFIRRVRLSFNGILILIILLLVLGISTVNILTKPELQTLTVKFLDGKYHDILLELPTHQRITAILTLYVNISFVFFVLLVLPNHRYFLCLIKMLVYTIVLAGLVAIAYSLYFEWDKYVVIFNEGYMNSSAVPQSFFGNRNPYASFLLNAQILLLFNYYISLDKKRRFFSALFQVPMSLAILFTFSKTNILLSAFIMAAAYLHHLIRLLRRKRYVSFIIELIVSSEFVMFVLVFRFIPTFKTTAVHEFLMRFFPDSIFQTGERTLEARITLWKYAMTLVVASPVTFFFGDGPHISRFFYFARMSQEIEGEYLVGVGDYHNGFVEMFHTFGLLGFVIYITIIIGSFVAIIRRFKTNRELAYFLIVALLIFVARSQTESLVMLLFKSEGILSSLTFVLPFLYLMRLSHRFHFGKEIRLKKSARTKFA